MFEILKSIFDPILYIPIFNLLVFFYKLFGNNLGLAIIAISVFVKLITYKPTLSQIEFANKQKELQPKLEKLKTKYKNQQTLAKKQMELYKEHGINPAGGCLPIIAQMIIVIPLYAVFRNILESGGVIGEKITSILYKFEYIKLTVGDSLNTSFLYMDLTKADPLYVLPVLAALSQYFMSKYMMGSAKKLEKIAEKTPGKADDMMADMQKMTAYMFPIMTLVIGITLPSGLVLYWFLSTLLSLGQYWLIRSKQK